MSAVRHPPAGRGTEAVVYHLPDAKGAKVWTTSVMINPRHRESGLIPGVKVALREVMVADEILGRDKSVWQLQRHTLD